MEEKIIVKLAIGLSWAGLKIKSEEDLLEAAEQIEMDMEEEKIELEEAVDNWIKNTQANYPEYFA